MARSFSNAKLLSVIVVNGLSNATSRRGYAASSQGIMAAVARGRGSAARMLKKPGERCRFHGEGLMGTRPRDRLLQTPESWGRDRRGRAACIALKQQALSGEFN
ncbi:Indole-3-acetic acid-induced protein ARG2 [Morella rubra]|uniref:Indole-3-acetic acid-induced protein ARG2 n=1 Tax=Morella rubra TaxID=262757 RepID=A0A6A1WCE0_9ROSI|nr:Indole-3-acetic acid-induced protein ARG2 [Morella rubra]